MTSLIHDRLTNYKIIKFYKKNCNFNEYLLPLVFLRDIFKVNLSIEDVDKKKKEKITKLNNLEHRKDENGRNWVKKSHS